MGGNGYWKDWLDGLNMVDNGTGVTSWGGGGCAGGHLQNLKDEKIVISSSKCHHLHGSQGAYTPPPMKYVAPYKLK